MRGAEGLAGRRGIGEDGAEIVARRGVVAEDRRVQAAVAQHGQHVAAGRGAVHPGRVTVFRDMRVLEGGPAHRLGPQGEAVREAPRSHMPVVWL